MKIAMVEVDGRSRMGVATGTEIALLPDEIEFADLPASAGAATTERQQMSAVTFLPCLPQAGRVFCVGLNYLKVHPISGAVTQRPVQPTIFTKVADSFVGHRGALRLPAPLSDQLDYECELAVVIGRGGRDIAEGDAYGHVFGYTILNDGSVRDWQKNSLFSGKNFVGSSSCGPWIVTADEVGDPMDLRLTTRLNGEPVQDTSTQAMLYDIAALIAHISAFTPLHPGDLIATGSPEGSGGSRNPVRFLRSGDRLEFEIARIGILSNVVV